MSNQKKPSFSNILLEMGICIILPSMILKKLSGEADLGTAGALVFALSLPLTWGIYEFIKNKKVGFIPALGFISILLTGSIGLLKLDSGYIAIKEAAIPLLIGIATLISTKTRFPLVKTFLYNDMVIEVEKVSAVLEEKQAQGTFDKIMLNATWMLAGSFFLSATLNYALAKYFITSPSGTAEFNSQLGSMNLWSYPVIVVPSMIVLFYAMFYIFRNITRITGLKLEEIMRS